MRLPRAVSPAAWATYLWLYEFYRFGVFTWDGSAALHPGYFAVCGVFAAFILIIQSLAFWIGTTSYLSGIALNAMITFAIYPITLFETGARLILFTVIPAALMGAVPASFVRSFGWGTLAQLSVGAVVFLTLAVAIFYTGLRRYESGSAIQVEV
jgi:ABC-2 type transport system permease protein